MKTTLISLFTAAALALTACGNGAEDTQDEQATDESLASEQGIVGTLVPNVTASSTDPNLRVRVIYGDIIGVAGRARGGGYLASEVTVSLDDSNSFTVPLYAGEGPVLTAWRIKQKLPIGFQGAIRAGAAGNAYVIIRYAPHPI